MALKWKHFRDKENSSAHGQKELSLQQVILETYLIPRCVGRGLTLASESLSSGGGSGVWKFGDLGIWKFENLESKNIQRNNSLQHTNLMSDERAQYFFV